MRNKLKCDCGATVLVQLLQVVGATSRGGHRTTEGRDAATCTKCGKEFTEAEIDDPARWVEDGDKR